MRHIIDIRNMSATTL